MMMPSPTEITFGPKVEQYKNIKIQQYDDSSSLGTNNVNNHHPPRKPLHQEATKNNAWVVPTSTKAIRAVNPVTFAFNRLADKVKLGSQRSDGKDPISLAVSVMC